MFLFKWLGRRAVWHKWVLLIVAVGQMIQLCCNRDGWYVLNNGVVSLSYNWVLFAEVFSEITSGSCSKSLRSFNRSRIWFFGIVQHLFQEEKIFCPRDRQECWPGSELGQFMVKTPQRKQQLFLFLLWMKPVLKHDGKDLLRLITGHASIKMWNTFLSSFWQLLLSEEPFVWCRWSLFWNTYLPPNKMFVSSERSFL